MTLIWKTSKTNQWTKLGSCSNNCGVNSVCTNGVCACQSRFADCNGQPDGCETNIMTNANNCGTCGTKCAVGEQCSNGTCQGCQAPDTYCNGQCRNFQNDRHNCGFCGNQCQQNQDCQQGQCVNGG